MAKFTITSTAKLTISGEPYVISVGGLLFRGSEEPGNHVGTVLDSYVDGDLHDAIKVHWQSGETTEERVNYTQ